MAKKRMEQQVQVTEWQDLFEGLGDFDPQPCPCQRFDTRMVEVAAPTKAQRKKLIERLIDKLDPPRKVLAKPKTVKRAPKKKTLPPPKKGKKVGKVNEVTLLSPKGHPQPIPLADIREIRELLLEGWQIVGDAAVVQEAYSNLKIKPEELKSA